MAMVQITLQLSNDLAERLAPFQDRLPELLERGLTDLLSDEAGETLNTEEIIEVLASQPTPEQILAIKPKDALQNRVSDLLARSKAGTLTAKEEAELERYLTIEHLVRLAKAHAYKQLKHSA
jgi:hypothetical protein